MGWQDYVVAAQGYLELGMNQSAWDELESMQPEDRARCDVIAMRLSILQVMEKWEMGAEIGRGAVKAFSERGELYLLGAYHIRRAEDIETAFTFLKSGQSCLEDEACFWFNLGCYHCQLGRLKDAKECVRKAVDLDRSYQELVLEEVGIWCKKCDNIYCVDCSGESDSCPECSPEDHEREQQA